MEGRVRKLEFDWSPSEKLAEDDPPGRYRSSNFAVGRTSRSRWTNGRMRWPSPIGTRNGTHDPPIRDTMADLAGAARARGLLLSGPPENRQRRLQHLQAAVRPPASGRRPTSGHSCRPPRTARFPRLPIRPTTNASIRSRTWRSIACRCIFRPICCRTVHARELDLGPTTPENAARRREILNREFQPLRPPGPDYEGVPGPLGHPLTLAELQRIGMSSSPLIKQAVAAVEVAPAMPSRPV